MSLDGVWVMLYDSIPAVLVRDRSSPCNGSTSNPGSLVVLRCGSCGELDGTCLRCHRLRLLLHDVCLANNIGSLVVGSLGTVVLLRVCMVCTSPQEESR